MERQTSRSLMKQRNMLENAIAKMGFRPKRVRVPFVAVSTSRYDAHQGNKERARRKARLEEAR
jgi:hypothetical protein